MKEREAERLHRCLGRICATTAALSATRCSTLFILKRLSQRLTVRAVGHWCTRAKRLSSGSLAKYFR